MKLSQLFHVLSVFVWFAGIVALLAAWYVGTDWTLFGMDEAHLFKDAAVLVLIAIWIKLATIHHLMLEEKGRIV